ELQLREMEKSRTKFQEILFENEDGLDLREFRKDDIWKKSEWYFYKEHSPDVVLPLVMRWAKGGALGPLATYMEASGVITDEVRNFVGGNLRGERAKPSNRRPSPYAYLNSCLRAEVVLAHQRREEKRERAIDEAADRCGVDRRTIQRDLKKWGAQRH